MRPKLLITVLLLTPVFSFGQGTLDDGIKELATQINTSATKQKKQKIAVLPFHELDGQPTVLGAYLAEELVTDLFQLGNFEIVERQLLDKVMGELKLEQSGAIDPKTAKEIGRVTGVDAIVTGSITDLHSFVGINCRLIDSSTGKIFGAAQAKITKDDDVRKIMSSKISTPASAVKDAEPPKVEEVKEENAEAGKVEGWLRACESGMAPERRQGVGRDYSMDRSPLCIKTRHGRVLRLALRQDVVNNPPVVYSGQSLALNELHTGDFIEATLMQSGTGAVVKGIVLKAVHRE